MPDVLADAGMIVKSRTIKRNKKFLSHLVFILIKLRGQAIEISCIGFLFSKRPYGVVLFCPPLPTSQLGDEHGNFSEQIRS